jgi:hypothetical protein
MKWLKMFFSPPKRIKSKGYSNRLGEQENQVITPISF